MLTVRTFASVLALSVAGAAMGQDAGDLGFSITVAPASPPVRAASVAADTTDAAGPVAAEAVVVDRLLDRMGVQVQYSGIGAEPKLNVVTRDLVDEVAPGQPVVFRAYSNYPAWIARAQVVVREGTRGRVVARLPVAPNGEVIWTPAPDLRSLTYTLEAFDAKGRRDATRPRVLAVQAQPSPAGFGGDSLDAFLAEDYAARRAIPVRGGAVVVSGMEVPEGADLEVMGERILAAPSQAFMVERILPPGVHGVTISGRDAHSADRRVEQVDVAPSEWFYTAMADVTIGREFEEGRLAGFADGVLADGTRVTARVDTEERPLGDLFDDFWQKDPKRILRDIDPSEPFLTYGDDSVREDLAPSSGRLFVRVARDGAVAQWGDFETEPLLKGLARESRTLYGASAQWESLDRTPEGAARRSVAAYVAAADTAIQRDTLRATGASAFFLSRRDIVEDSASVAVEVRDSLTGQVLDRRTLTEGVDYRVNTVQGVVVLQEPLSFFTDGGGLVGGGRSTEVFLVAAYEYVPIGPVDGTVAGGRAEAWVGDHTRIGIEGRADTSSTPSTDVVAADVLVAPTERTSVLLEAAQSRGPGGADAFSNSGGLVFEPETRRLSRDPAWGTRLTARADLADLGWGNGTIDAFVAHEEGGFVGPEGVVESDRLRARLAAEVALSEATALTFGARADRETGGLKEQDFWLGVEHRLANSDTVLAEVRRTERDDNRAQTDARADNLGARTDVALRYTRETAAGTGWWVYGQATVERSGGMRRDDRVGAGAAFAYSPAVSVSADVSYGSLGWGAEVGVTENRAGLTRTLAYRLDPQRRFDEEGFFGTDKGVLVASSSREWSDELSQTSEFQYDAFGARPSATSRYGLAWTPGKQWRYEAAVISGRGTTEDGDRLRKTGVTAGVSRTDAEGWSVALRGEWVRDRSEDARDENGNVDTYVLKASAENRMSEDWRFQSNIDGLWSDSAVTGVGTGRYVEAKAGFAYRPAQSDRTIGLFSYTYLDDRPAAGQENFDGDTNGDGQRSHILNVAVSYQINTQWTVGGKYGLRHRKTFAVGEGAVRENSWTQMAALRADYHITHKWDATGEVRGLWHGDNGHEYGALVSVSRQITPNARLGVGYAWGGVSDDLRTIKPEKEGPFLNLTLSF